MAPADYVAVTIIGAVAAIHRGDLCTNNAWSGPNCLTLAEGMARARRYIRHRELSFPRWGDSNECGLPLSSSRNSRPEALFLPAGLAMVVEQVMRGLVNCLVSIDHKSGPPDRHVRRCLKSIS